MVVVEELKRHLKIAGWWMEIVERSGLPGRCLCDHICYG